MTACVQSGMQLQRLEEHPHHNREVDYDIYENQSAQMPLSYTLVAQATLQRAGSVTTGCIADA